jgi:hypothetical protein
LTCVFGLKMGEILGISPSGGDGMVLGWGYKVRCVVVGGGGRQRTIGFWLKRVEERWLVESLGILRSAQDDS